MSTRTYVYSTVLEQLTCGECHIPFAIPVDLYTARRRDGRTFCCPNGHNISWTDNENVRLKREKSEADARIRRLEQDRSYYQEQVRRKAEEVKHQERRASGYKGALVKTQRRVRNGVCPCCQRSFVDLGRHMAGQHPNYGSTA